MDTLVVRRMTEDELGLALDWAAEEGWNPGLFNSASFIAADADGFFLGECGGEPIGCVSAVRYGERFGFLGLYIVKPQHRGKGFGLKLWRAAMEHFGDRNIGLDGVVAQQQRYTKSGFKLAWRNIRYQGEGGGAAPAGLADLSSIPFDEILRYDALAFPAPRERFLRSWIAQPRSTALGTLERGRLTGYGVLRACRRGFRIGPLFADDPEIADLIFRGLARRAPGEPIVLDAPEANPAAVELARRYGMAPVFETARMYTKEAPSAGLNRCFGVTTFELG